VAETVAVALDRSVAVKVRPVNACIAPARRRTTARPAVARRVDELLELFGLMDYRDSFTAELSTGTRRIVELACVVATSPRCCFSTNRLGGVAQKRGRAARRLLLRIRSELGCAMLVIEHDMPLVAGLADRLVALEPAR
jgi:ABC-type branched-subunit amino acid transport system ATPase component